MSENHDEEEQEYECDYCGRPMDFVEAQFGNMCRVCRDKEEEMALEMTHKQMEEHEKEGRS